MTPTTTTHKEGLDHQRVEPDFTITGEISIETPLAEDSQQVIIPEGTDTADLEANPDGMLAFLQTLKLIGELHRDGYRLWRGILIRVDAPSWRNGLWWCEIWYWSSAYGEMRRTFGWGYGHDAAVFTGLRNWVEGRPASRFVKESVPAEEIVYEDYPVFTRSYTRRLRPARIGVYRMMGV